MKYTYIIAEGGVAHEGSYTNALGLLNIASAAKADAFKLQWAKEGTMGANRVLPYLTYAKMEAIGVETGKRGLDFICTPHDPWALEHLEEMQVCKAYKVGSGDWPMLEAVLTTDKRTYISTGMHTRHEIEVMICTYDTYDTVFMHCVSEYPTKPENAQLEMILHMQEMTSRPIGYSDHTVGIHIPLAAVAYAEASVIEKHITLEKNIPGKQDTFVAADCEEFCALVRHINHFKDAIIPVEDRPLTGGERLTQAWVKKRLDHAQQQK